MPGANTYGSLSRSSRRRVAGSAQRDTGTVKPGGRSGVSLSVLARTVVAIWVPSVRLLVRVVELAELRAAALRLLRLAPLVGPGDAKDRPVLGRRAVGAVKALHGRHGRASCVPEMP